jgi:outer membrane receptor protein involved in Fe transport
MPGVTWSRSAKVVAILFFSGLFSLPAVAQILFDLPSQPLAQALTSVGNLANLNIYFDPRLVDGHQAPALKASLTVDEALARLLAGTQLHAVRVDENTVRVVADPESKNAQSGAPPTGSVHPPNKVHLAYAGDGQSMNARGQRLAAGESNEAAGRGSEVVVTAEKREERLEDVPVPVTAINADALGDTNKLRLQDYYTQVPGLSVTPSDRGGAPQVTIRGITTGGYTNPTVGITVDDVPFGSSTNLAVVFAPDIDPTELDHIEVLRGPQGTLYGASSLGGLVKYVTTDPSTDALSGRVQAGTSTIHHGADAGYNFRGAVNVPLSDEFAFRASGYLRRDPGYIDNVQTGERDVNQVDNGGARLSALWRPSEAFSLKLSALYQRSAQYGSPFVDIQPGLAELQQNMLPDTGRSTSQIQAYSATIHATVGGGMDLTSITGYNVFKFTDTPDATPLLGPATQVFFGVTGTPVHESFRTTKVTEELRLSGRPGDFLDWLIGGFYTHESSSNIQDILAADPTGAIVGSWTHDDFPSGYSEFAGFADLTLHITDRFDLQVGGRESQNRQTYMETYTGIYTKFLGGDGVTPLVNPEIHTKDSSFTYLVTPQFRLTDDLMLYARLASGYRPGGPNVSAGVAGLPTSYKADTTHNYEFGAKGNLLDHLVVYDVSAYYIDWRDIQLQLRNPTGTIAYDVNASRAKSQGLELALETHPLKALKFATALSYGDAVLTQALPPGGPGSVVGTPGDRLPYSARFSGNVSVQQDFPLWGSASGFVGARFSYVGERQGIFRPAPPRQVFPSYTQIDLNTGAHSGNWNLDLYVNNVTDRRGVLSGGIGTLIPYEFIFIQPMTVGLLISRTF